MTTLKSVLSFVFRFMKFIGIKMLGSRFLFLAVLLCYATQPQDVLAGKRKLNVAQLNAILSHEIISGSRVL